MMRVPTSPGPPSGPSHVQTARLQHGQPWRCRPCDRDLRASEMSLETKDVAIACSVGLVAWLLLTHWLPSLRWIPYAFVAGCLSTTLAFAYLLLTTSKGTRLHRGPPTLAPPAFIRPGIWDKEKAAVHRRSAYTRSPLYPQSPAVSTRIDGLLDLILRDYVSSWYKNITARPVFQNEIDRAIRSVLSRVGDRVASLDVVEIAVAKFVPLITNHMRDYSNAERAVRGKDLARDMTASDELDMAVASKYRDGKLHPAATLAFSDTKLTQQAHLRNLVSRLLPILLPPNMQSSRAVTSLIREVVACAVLTPIVLMLSDPDTFNQLMEGFVSVIWRVACCLLPPCPPCPPYPPCPPLANQRQGRTLLHDRKTVRKLRAALDEHATPSPNSAKAAHFPRLRPNDNERHFERFVRAIRHCSTLPDARRFRSEVASQLRKATSGPDRDPVYIKRLEAGRHMLDQKIALFAANGSPQPTMSKQPSSASVDQVTRADDTTLLDVLLNSSGLSYFMEFMDRRNRMRLVQFWIVVDGFRNPLEEDTEEPGQELQTKWTPADRLDLEQMYDAYLTKPEIGARDVDRKAVQDFLRAGSSASTQLYLTARKAVLRTQSAVFEEMKDQHFRSFKKSDLFYKWLATEESTILSPTLESSSQLRRSQSNPKEPSIQRDIRPSKTLPPNLDFESNLQKPVMSATDLKSLSRPTPVPTYSRQSIDNPRSRPLFDDDIEDDRMSRSVPAIGAADPEPGKGRNDAESAEVVDAMQAALNQIMDEPDKDSLFSDHLVGSGQTANSPRNSIESSRPSLLQQRSKPSISSLGLVGAPSSLGVFSDDLFSDEQKFPEDEKEDSDAAETPLEDDIHEAAPGDLGLTEAIDALNSDIQRLTSQEAILVSLTRKAELTNNAAELRILRKSMQSLQREIQRKEMQKQQYIIQESDNSLYGRAAVAIKSIMVGKDQDGHEYALCQYQDHSLSLCRAHTNALALRCHRSSQTSRRSNASSSMGSNQTIQ